MLWAARKGAARSMVPFNRTDLDQLERREFHITILSAVFVFVQATGLIAFMYPLVFIHSEDSNKWTMRVVFFGFCILSALFVGYVFDRQNTVQKLRRQLLEELERNVELRVQANVDLLLTMPDVTYFWDRLTMEHRRAMTTQQSLSLVLVKCKPGVAGPALLLGSSKPSFNAAETKKTNTSAWGDAAKAMSRKLRPTDSIYRLASNVFGVVLPETDMATAKNVASQLQDELKPVRAKHGHTFDVNIYNYPEHVRSSHEMENIVKFVLADKETSSLAFSAM